MDEPRRFPLPWTIGETEACYYVQDASGAKLAYCYFLTRDRLAHDASKLDRAEALKIARNIAKLPVLLQQLKDRTDSQETKENNGPNSTV